jgi:hypothetical protein
MTIVIAPEEPTIIGTTAAEIGAPLLHAYRNGGYEVSIYANGTKVRHAFDPSIAPEHPEQMDLKITDWCDAGCAWCHEKSTTRGQHGDVDAMLNLLKDLPPGVEIAIGGGDPLSHPGFSDLVAGLRGFGLIPSVTVNGRHIARHRAQLETLIGRGHVFGVGVSFFDEMPDWDYEHMVVHMIAGVDKPEALDDVKRSKLLILGYKNFGRGEKYRHAFSEKVQANIDQWFRELPILARNHHLSFDTLAISLLRPDRLFKDRSTYEKRYMGDEGQFSMYVDGVMQQAAISSYSKDRYEWTDIRSMYQVVRRESGHTEAEAA